MSNVFLISLRIFKFSIKDSLLYIVFQLLWVAKCKSKVNLNTVAVKFKGIISESELNESNQNNIYYLFGLLSLRTTAMPSLCGICPLIL